MFVIPLGLAIQRKHLSCMVYSHHTEKSEICQMLFFDQSKKGSTQLVFSAKMRAGDFGIL
jgi:acetylglutamate synthase